MVALPLGDGARDLQHLGDGRLGEEQGEVVAAQAGGQARARLQALQAGGDLAQHGIAGGMPRQIIQGLEFVQIEQQQYAVRNTAE